MEQILLIRMEKENNSLQGMVRTVKNCHNWQISPIVFPINLQCSFQVLEFAMRNWNICFKFADAGHA